jgi:hypothetical protein
MTEMVGYAFVRAIQAYRQSLTHAEQECLRDVLFESLTHEDPQLWGVALESVIREAAPDTPDRLMHVFAGSEHSVEWKDQVILGLLRLAYKEALLLSLAHITAGLEQNRLAVLPLLAALCKVDANHAVRIAAQYLGTHLGSEAQAVEIRGYIPAFVRYSVQTDRDL